MKTIIFVLATVWCIFSMSGYLLANTIVTDGLVSYWTFDLNNIDGNLVEDVWGENHAEIVGQTNISDGYIRQGLELKGLKNYVIIPNFGNFGSQLGPFTFEIIVKTSYKISWTPIYRVVEAPHCDKGNRGHGILINATIDFQNRGAFPLPLNNMVTKEDSIYLQRSFRRQNGCSSHSSGFPSQISDGKWHHIVYTYGAPFTDDSGNEWRQSSLYVDGEQKYGRRFNPSNPEDALPYTQPIYLGAINKNGNATRPFRGIIDEVRVYDRGLSYEEVNQNYQSKIGLGVESTHKLPTIWGTLKKR
ncbi:hypothetical protein C6497_09715 [Candidatus Poribacteria bacterium]|nr:MAG: hypothetical protein C6497_09715 [Candidatus Poribacteria bacterium]